MARGPSLVKRSQAQPDRGSVAWALVNTACWA
ncbi:Uncharacterised protein [Bordetella pertussis]|nr:Uncharacterised protein [Bordetella pertussis]CFW51612.1 Uncharacterised protein [Bordetella pertussis]